MKNKSVKLSFVTKNSKHLVGTSGDDLPALRACLHGGGGPQVGEVTRLGGVTRLSI